MSTGPELTEDDAVVRRAVHALVDRRHLTRQESAAAMNAIMSGLVSESLIAAFLVALRMKGETVEEITGCAEAMRSKASRVPASTERLIDTCGTGGDHTGTFNISTAAAVVAAAAGARVAKHGNRAVSSRSGSADALRALGVNIDISPQKAGAVLERVGITFIFAPTVHPAMKYAIGVRKDLSMRSVFNVLGPLTNPAGVRRQVLGVYDPALTEPLASVLGALGAEHAWVVHGAGGMDECSLAGPTRVSEWKDGSVHTTELRPSDAGLSEARLEELHGGDAQANAAIIRQILDGHRGAKTDATLFNAGAALVVAGVESNLRSGVERAREAVQSGMARRLLQQWIEATRSMT